MTAIYCISLCLSLEYISSLKISSNRTRYFYILIIMEKIIFKIFSDFITIFKYTETEIEILQYLKGYILKALT